MIKVCALRRKCVCERTVPCSTCRWRRCSGKGIESATRFEREPTRIRQDLESLVRDFHRCADRSLCSLRIEVNETSPSKLVDKTTFSEAFEVAIRGKDDSDQRVARVDHSQIDIGSR